MSIRARGKDRWQVKVYRGRDDQGRETWEYRTVQGLKRDAQRVEREMLDADREIAPSQRTVADAIDAYLDRGSARLSPETLRQHDYNARRWINPRLGKTRLDDLRVSDVTNWLRQVREECSPQTTRLAFGTLRAALNSAVRNEWIGSNPASFATEALPKRDPKPLTIPTVTDVQRVLAWARENDPDLEAGVLLGALCGLRRGEVVGIRWDEVDGSTVALPRTKTGKVRHVSLPTEVVTAIDEVRKRQRSTCLALGVPRPPTVFSMRSDPSAPSNPNAFSFRWADCQRALDLTWRFHDLRHFHATQLIAAGVDVRTVAHRLGHTTPTLTLNTYAHLVSAADRAAADIASGWLS